MDKNNNNNKILKSIGFISRNVHVIAALFVLAMLIALQYTQFADSAKPFSLDAKTFSDGAHKLQSIVYDTDNNQRIYPVTNTGIDSSGTFIDDTFIDDTINNLFGEDGQPELPLAGFNFAAAGDWGCDSYSPETVENIVDRSPEIVLGLGDYSYQPTADCWFEVIDPIDSLTKIAFGNHDVESSTLTNQYLRHFGLERQFYSFDYQNVHFLVVSSEIPYNVGSKQYNFVNGDLASAVSDPSIEWIVAIHHKMEYTSKGTHASESSLRQALHPLFDKYGVDLVLQAHNHSYERTYPLQYDSASPSSPIITNTSTKMYNDPTGVIYVTVGTGGAPNYEYTEKMPYSIIQWIGHGFLNIDVVDNGLTMKGTLYSNDGTINDSFTINKSESNLSRTRGDSSTALSSNSTSLMTTTITTSASAYPVTNTGIDSSGTFIDDTFIDDTINNLFGEDGQPELPLAGFTPLSFVKNPSTPILLGHTEPDVIKVGDTFYMYYRNDATNGASISVMSSSDGLNWVERGTVLSKSSSGWDSAEVIAPSVYFDGSTYYLYYEAGNATGKRAIGVATAESPTGPFTKYSGNPVLKPTLSWEGATSSGYGIVGTPVITRASNGIFYLFYHGFKSGADRVGVAYSNNPLGPWSKEPNNPILDLGASGSWDDAKVAPSSVYFDGATKVMVFYEGFNGNQAPVINWRIGIADGEIDPEDGRIKSLTRQGAPAIDLGAEDSWDDAAVQLPSVIRVGDKLWVYYSGNDGKAFRLGRAVAQLP